MFPLLFVALLIGGVAYAASQKETPRRPGPGVIEVVGPASKGPTVKPPKVVEPPEVVEPREPEPAEPEGMTWELWVLDDGRVVDEAGDKYLKAPDVDVCPNDVLILHVPRGWGEPVMEGGKFGSWVSLVSRDSYDGLYIWEVHSEADLDYRASSPGGFTDDPHERLWLLVTYETDVGPESFGFWAKILPACWP